MPKGNYIFPKMAINVSPVTLILLIELMLWSGVKAQSGCTMAMVSLSPCLNYVSGNSSTPSSSCCSRLSSVVQSQPQCLCTLLKGGASSLGVTINQTLALDLPGACNVQTPPVSRCNGVNGAATSAPTPASSPSDSPADETPEAPDSPSVPGTPEAPDTPSVPDTPEIPDTPEVPDTPSEEEPEPDIPSDTGSRTVPRADGAYFGGTNTGPTFSFIGVLLSIASSCAFSGIGL
ncbi:hypothetical protein CDL12_07842 [Handroanthus impetiginosus]|uniref:Bifunctional inhibitor/plant lipid transfer protein/seed storage helical domain-containing protein n=1 Tax=Handroanthus impetiginosus TaxID=429701 RepID=A0A2G9HPM0_9LAMI|nr:hypothetical protein CDL12_07842 [Handroanthus impetiginosus]